MEIVQCILCQVMYDIHGGKHVCVKRAKKGNRLVTEDDIVKGYDKFNEFITLNPLPFGTPTSKIVPRLPWYKRAWRKVFK